MEWPIARAITGDERVDIQLLAHNRFTVFLWEYLFKYSIMSVWISDIQLLAHNRFTVFVYIIYLQYLFEYSLSMIFVWYLALGLEKLSDVLSSSSITNHHHHHHYHISPPPMIILIRFLNNRELAHVSFSLHRLLDEPRVQLVCCLLDMQVNVGHLLLMRTTIIWYVDDMQWVMMIMAMIQSAGEANKKRTPARGRKHNYNNL